MPRRIVLVLLLTLTAFGSLLSTALAAKPAATYVPGDVLVEFRATSGAPQARLTARASHAHVDRFLATRTMTGGRTVALLHSSERTTDELVASLSADPSVAAVSPNYIRHAFSVTPDDPYFPAQWSLTKIGAPDAWSLTTGSSSVVIANIDEGVDYTHPDLAANMWVNPGEIAGNSLDDDSNGYVDDVYGVNTLTGSGNPMDTGWPTYGGHGTHTSGGTAAVGNNAVGVAGLAWNTRIMAVKFLGPDGGTDADAIAGINYVIDQKVNHGVNVVAINASWGGGDYNVLLRNAVANAGTAGIVFCAAAGNGGYDGVGDNNDTMAEYPANFTCANIIAVAATTPSDGRAGFSNYGHTSVDLGAPGTGIWSTVPGGSYESWSGTSMATPYVTGAVALCAALYPAESASQLIDRILGSVTPVSSLTNKTVTGGRLNVSAALAAATPPGDTTAPKVTVVGATSEGWYNSGVIVKLTATDDFGGGGVASITYSLDGVPFTVAASSTQIVIPAEPNARHTIVYHATDVGSNVGADKALAFTTDTVGPATFAFPASGNPGTRIALRYRITDNLSPRAWNPRVVIRDSHGTIVKRFMTASSVSRLVDTTYRFRWTPRKAGLYRFTVYAKDTAGNTQSSRDWAKIVVW